MATKNRFRSPATIAATLLLTLAAILFFSLTASAEEADKRPSVVGGFVAGPLPSDGDISGAVGVPTLPGTSEGEEDSGRRDKRLWLTIPELGMKNLLIRTSSGQSFLDREGIMHLAGTDFPWEAGSKEGSNTYIAGHAIGYPGGRVPEAFRRLSSLDKDDLITLRDARGNTYRYRVNVRVIVDPLAIWVTEPVAGRDVVSLQTCYPEPTFEKRLIVRAELVE